MRWRMCCTTPWFCSTSKVSAPWSVRAVACCSPPRADRQRACAVVVLLLTEVPLADVCAVLRKRFGTSGIDEKAARTPK